ncbi:hypothetical protein HNQ80_004820 [Anaerosolibacter carboniphilus]|uniref:XkdX family protein n=1 Tax=Anaerosolibacter carboniphilus TaxID=1417629 RepID=A0A841KY11_9FIRM|nr:XkdX family protein [Anaerosolibacter carboniphilus]MBB6218646.1 hypothetical protein [Anaerosolibacter carboniphilus]
MMTEFQKWQYYYGKGWASVEQLRLVVQYNKISPEEFEQITGQPYETPEE